MHARTHSRARARARTQQHTHTHLLQADAEENLRQREMHLYCLQTKAIQQYHLRPDQCCDAPTETNNTPLVTMSDTPAAPEPRALPMPKEVPPAEAAARLAQPAVAAPTPPAVSTPPPSQDDVDVDNLLRQAMSAVPAQVFVFGISWCTSGWMYTHTCIHTFMYACVHTHTCIHANIHIHVHTARATTADIYTIAVGRIAGIPSVGWWGGVCGWGNAGSPPGAPSADTGSFRKRDCVAFDGGERRASCQGGG